MRPVLFRVLDEPFPAYFTLLLVGFAVCTWVAARAAERAGLDRETIIDLGLYSLIVGVGGARLLHVFADGYFWDYVHLCTDPAQVAWKVTQGECERIGRWDAAAGVCRPTERDCFAWAAFWSGGLTYYGGLFSAGVFGIYFLKRRAFPLGKGVDLVGMVMPLGLFFGRMGCFLSGCCFGYVDLKFPLAVSFPAWSAASDRHWKDGLLSAPSLPSLPVHPTQLYEAFGSLAIAAFLMFVLRPRKRFDGQVFVAFVFLYAVLRFLLEYLRADDRGGWGPFSTSQWIGIGLALLCAAAWYTLAQRAKQEQAKRASTARDAP